MIDPRRLSIVEKEKQTYMRYQLSAQEQVSKIELEMLKNNKIPNVLSVTESQDDDKHIFLYNVTGKYQLAQRFTYAFDGQELYNMLKSLCRIWQQVGDYMQDIEHFILYPEFLCIDPDVCELYAMVLPIEDENGQKWDFKYLLNGIFQKLIYQDPSMETFAEDIFSYITQMQQIHIKEFEEFLDRQYRAVKGILNPVSDAPEQPEETEGAGRQILHEEEAKENLKRRFEVQNYEEIRHWEETIQKHTDVSAGFFQKKETSSTERGFVMPDGNGKSKTVSVIPEKSKKEKPIKEKPKKELAIPGAEIKQRNGEEKKEMKEKKGLFSGLFGKKKEQKEDGVQKTDFQTSPLKPIEPITDVKPIEQNPENGLKNQNRQAIEKNQIPPQSAVYPVWRFPGVQNNQDKTPPSQFIDSQGQNKNSVQNSVFEKQQGIDLNATVPDISKVDLNATVPDISNIDLNATIADEKPTRNQIILPALRSRNTGEVIKITGNGFLVGRQRVENGKPVISKGEKQPDLPIQQGNISRSHARFIYKDQKWYLEDLDSLNGTYVNNLKIEGVMKEALQEGDQIRFATTDPVEFEFLLDN